MYILHIQIVPKTPDGFLNEKILRQSGSILLTLAGIFHAHENSSGLLLFEYDFVGDHVIQYIPAVAMERA
jgi:hypothetical protein